MLCTYQTKRFFQYFKYKLLRAFDHICMEKARYKFLIIINYYNENTMFIDITILTIHPLNSAFNTRDLNFNYLNEHMILNREVIITHELTIVPT